MTPSDLAKEISRDMNLKFEQHIRLCIKPKPHWLPHAAWRWLLQRLVVGDSKNRQTMESEAAQAAYWAKLDALVEHVRVIR